jgi:hypothetical protein
MRFLLILPFFYLPLVHPAGPTMRSLPEISRMKIDHHMISSGDNFPAIHLERDSLDLLLVSLRFGHDPEEIREYFRWDRPTMDSRINLLLSNDYLVKGEDGYHPTISILTIEEAQMLREKSRSVVGEISDSIVSIIPQVTTAYRSLSVAHEYSYADLGFFLLSDVLLDNWQINNVENDFLRKPRTPRHGKNYFYQIAEKDTGSSIEAFGVYGNQYQCGDSTCWVMYGNNRNAERKSMEEFQTLRCPDFSRDDQQVFDDLAAMFQPTLLSILERHRTAFINEFNHSDASAGMSFEEYFIWWYHLVYTDVTDALAAKGYLTVPEKGVFFYKFRK